jgi:predicted nucleic acid-binding protein
VDRLAQSLSTYKLLETTATDIRRAKEVQRLLADKHQRGRKVPDLLIAATAERTNLTILHYDTDFDLIAEVTGQPCQWIVPRGSVN